MQELRKRKSGETMRTIEFMTMWDAMHPEESMDENGTFWDDLVWMDRNLLHLAPNLQV
jgi:hypothetical protein